jgi:DNA-binding MarR family transcriptional regulator
MNKNAKDAVAGTGIGETRRNWERPPQRHNRENGPACHRRPSDKTLNRIAQAIVNLRARRVAMFGPQIAANFSDPSWEMSLELFIAHVAKRSISATDLCLTTNVSQSTALRHIAVLVDGGFVVRQTDTRDNRRVVLSLSYLGVCSMRKLLGSMVGEIK